jgi:hypothetical protein
MPEQPPQSPDNNSLPMLIKKPDANDHLGRLKKAEYQFTFLNVCLKDAKEDILNLNRAVGGLKSDATVFDVKIDSLERRFKSSIDAVNYKIDSFEKRLTYTIDAVEKRLTYKTDAVEKHLTYKTDAVEKRLTYKIDAFNYKVDTVEKCLTYKIDAINYRSDNKIGFNFSKTNMNHSFWTWNNFLMLLCTTFGALIVSYFLKIYFGLFSK